LTTVFDRLNSDGHSTNLTPEPEERSIPGEELWWPPGGSSGVVVTERTALRYAAVLATLNTVATDVAVLPLNVFQKLAAGGRREARDHPVEELLTRSPNGGDSTPLAWRQALMGHALEYGNGYAEIVRRGRGTPYELHLLDPETTRAYRREGQLGYQLGGVAGGWLEAANVLHVAGLGYDGISGYSFIRLINEGIGLGMGAQTYAADFFGNGSESGGAIETPLKLNPEGLKNLRDGWEGRHQGPGRRHRVAILEQGAKYSPTSTDPEKTQLLETRKFQVLDVVRPWRVPPHKVGDFSQAHLANIEASNLDYLMTCLIGWLEAIEQQFNLKLFSRAEWLAGYYVEHNVNALLRGDIATRFNSYEVALRNGWMNRDQVRDRENLNPMGAAEGGDIYTVQSQNIPLKLVGVTPAVQPQPGTGTPTNGRPKTEPDPKPVA
jgi:HK97 family phage portal protein